MPHAAIIGMQQSGKTTLATYLAREAKRRGFPLVVLDPHMSPHWRADWMTDDLGKLLRKLRASRRCVVFVEETGDESEGSKPLGRQPGFSWLFTQAHHWGHVTHYLSQYHAQVKPVVRCNVRRLFLFTVGPATVKEWAEQLAKPQLLSMVEKLNEFEFVVTGATKSPPVVRRLSAAMVATLT